MTREIFRRVSATNPGKHGPKDWRVEFGGMAPEHAEIVFMVGMLLVAEQRYDGPHDKGPYLLWGFLDRLLTAKSPDKVREIAEDCADSITNPPKTVRVRSFA